MPRCDFDFIPSSSSKAARSKKVCSHHQQQAQIFAREIKDENAAGNA